MAFSRIIKIKLKFFKSMQNKITEKYQLYFFSFILEKKNLKEKRLKDYTTQQHFNSERKKKEGRKRRKKKKEKKIKLIMIAIGTLHISYILSFIICRQSSIKSDCVITWNK